MRSLNLSNIFAVPRSRIKINFVFLVGMPLTLLTISMQYFIFATSLMDDAFIMARYGRNLSQLGEFSFNVGEPINVMTSAWHGIWLAILDRLSHNALTANQVFSAICVALATLFALCHLPRKHLSLCLCITGFALNPYLGLWICGGLETGYLFAAVLILTTCYYRLPRTSIIADYSFAACIIIRPDSIIPLSPFLLKFIKFRSPGRVPHLIRSIIFPFLFYGALTLYFGHPIGSSWYAKVPPSSMGFITQNILYSVQFLALSGVIPLGCLIWLPLIRHRRTTFFQRGIKAHIQKCFVFYISIFLLLGYAAITATVHMMFAYRTFIPYLPLFYFPLFDIFRRLKRLRMTPYFSPQLIAGFLFFFQLSQMYLLVFKSLNPGFIGEFRNIAGTSELTQTLKPHFFNLVHAIQEHRQLNDPKSEKIIRVSTPMAGIFGYYIPNIYIFDPLVSFREHCKADTKASADYLISFTFNSQSNSVAATDINSPLPIIYNAVTVFGNDTLKIQILFNANPRTNPLPATRNGECLSDKVIT